ncbi:MAG TPA: dihydrodipicolinate synthase family protein [Paracoccaceae bacterium]|nr:dihydrodipicolinate synthase family protein [Paracoccaceae bacterium]
MSVLRGVIAPNLTPFEDDLTIAEGLYLDHAEWLLAEGCVGLAPFGTTGEALSLGIEERMATLEAMVARGIDPARLIPGTGLTNLPDTVRLTRHAVDQGCAGAMILPPFYYKGVPEDGLYDYFGWLIEAVDRPALKIYLYHIPQVAGVGIPPAVVRRLHAAFPETIVGIKDSSGDWENTKRLLAIENFTVYPSQETTLVEGHALGAAGCITATANLNPAAIARLIGTIEAGSPDAGLNEEVSSFRKLIAAAGHIPAQKALLARWTGDARWARTRPPQLPMAAAQAARLADDVAALPGYRRPAA